jgi:acyl-CoA reductase-like NAD-dependent aldehyde dehydrogenase
MVVGGQSVESADGQYLSVENPATRTTIGEVPRATDADVDLAVRRAAAAFDA